jgi:putative transcriptional regulator
MKPVAGTFLVASSSLNDPNFMRSVIYLLEHGDAGTMGLIVNRPLDMPLSAIWDGVPAGLADAVIAAEGGPVERDRGLLLHGLADLPGCQRIGDGVAIGGDVAALAARFGGGADQCGPRLFLGHSGWGPGQLAQELEQGSWVVRPGHLDHLLVSPPTDLWRRLIDGGGTGLPEPSVN